MMIISNDDNDDDDDSSERDTSLLNNSTFILHVSVPGWNKGLQPFFATHSNTATWQTSSQIS